MRKEEWIAKQEQDEITVSEEGSSEKTRDTIVSGVGHVRAGRNTDRPNEEARENEKKEAERVANLLYEKKYLLSLI